MAVTLDRCRELGRRLLGEEAPAPYPFQTGPCWSFTSEYRVEDLEAELGFFAGLLGFAINSRSADYCMFTDPDKRFFLSVRRDASHPTPPGAVELQLMIRDIGDVFTELENRGVEFQQSVQKTGPNERTSTAVCRTPHGVKLTLWCYDDAEEIPVEPEICIVTVTGDDRVGIIARIAIAMAELNINITDVNQKIMEEMFVMTMACDIAKSTIGLTELRERLNGIGAELGLEITIQNESLFHAMHRI